LFRNLNLKLRLRKKNRKTRYKKSRLKVHRAATRKMRQKRLS